MIWSLASAKDAVRAGVTSTVMMCQPNCVLTGWEISPSFSAKATFSNSGTSWPFWIGPRLPPCLAEPVSVEFFLGEPGEALGRHLGGDAVRLGLGLDQDVARDAPGGDLELVRVLLVVGLGVSVREAHAPRDVVEELLGLQPVLDDVAGVGLADPAVPQELVELLLLALELRPDDPRARSSSTC